MLFIANFWWLWLIILVLCIIIAISNQINRMKRMTKNFGNLDPKKTSNDFFSGIITLLVTGILMWGSLILLVIAIIFKIIVAANNLPH